MNKLNVALKLIQLLNERKYINSKIIARELNVSIRTAQRYLTDLSFMPCVVNQDNNHTYALNPDYKVKDILANNGIQHDIKILHKITNQAIDIKHSLCLLCGDKRNYFDNISIFDKSNSIIKNKYEVDKLASMIKNRLAHKKCSFP
jgi:hypothetical protein